MMPPSTGRHLPSGPVYRRGRPASRQQSWSVRSRHSIWHPAPIEVRTAGLTPWLTATSNKATANAGGSWPHCVASQQSRR